MALKYLFFSFLFMFNANSAIASEFKSGDIVFRQENSIVSRIFAEAENSEYAHIGIIFNKDNETFVVHSEIADGEDGLRVQKWNDFIKNANRWMVTRHNKNVSLSKINFAIEKYIRLKPKFNLAFSHGNKDKMYCTELVNAIYLDAYDIELAKTKTKYSTFEFISTKDIYQNKDLNLIRKF
ncbi:MAG: YiiX/YebB-like N1pC/P60 family cysteine hydrolase [Sulfurimonas sp.]|uniref:YiiX/YebB-like N1pC/P60 family cysteine hydrolase n=1 Tax=Sulfurimonas sp. TaxID=2022749 RepID=UPI003D0DB1A7